MDEIQQEILLKASRQIEEFCNQYLIYIIPQGMDQVNVGQDKLAVGILGTKNMSVLNARILARDVASELSSVRANAQNVTSPVTGPHTMLRDNLERLFLESRFTAWLVIGKEVNDGKEDSRFILYKGNTGISAPYTDLVTCLSVSSDDLPPNFEQIT